MRTGWKFAARSRPPRWRTRCGRLPRRAPTCLADLYAAGDSRPQALLGAKAAQGFALLVLAEIERGNAEGIRLAHAPMMLFDSPAAGARYAAGVAAALRGVGAAPHGHAHAGNRRCGRRSPALQRKPGATTLLR
jgi:hypothetical protein